MSIDYAELARLARKGRRAEQRGKAATGCLSALVLIVLSALQGGWYLMLAAGVIHAEWIHQLPTLGYWWAVLIAFLLRGALAPAVSNSKAGA